MKLAFKINSKAQLCDFILYCLERHIDVKSCVIAREHRYDSHAFIISAKDLKCYYQNINALKRGGYETCTDIKFVVDECGMHHLITEIDYNSIPNGYENELTKKEDSDYYL